MDRQQLRSPIGSSECATITLPAAWGARRHPIANRRKVDTRAFT
jgi:hypothetical protein